MNPLFGSSVGASSPLAVAAIAPPDAGEMVAVVGGGPAGLMAADVLAAAGYRVHLFDRMPSVGRKFLLAGRGGLNLTHSEPMPNWAGRLGERAKVLAPMLDDFGNQHVCEWASSLGVETFVGTSGRVFPIDMKAAPLLRTWLHRLRHPTSGYAVQFHPRHHWTGWTDVGELRFETPQGEVLFQSLATVLALGGASWSRLGSDGAWVQPLGEAGVDIAPLKPSNCGFDVAGGWTPHFQGKFAGQPLKSVSLSISSVTGAHGGDVVFSRRGECVITQTGLEGSVVYAASAMLRDQIAVSGQAEMRLDLLPDWSLERVIAAVSAPRGSRSLSSHLKSRLSLDGVKLGLLYEQLDAQAMRQPQTLAQAIKALPIMLASPRPLDEVISTAGGVRFEAIDDQGMLRARAGVFCAGEMLDWEAPTGGYLLTTCLSLGRWAGHSAVRYLATNHPESSAAV